MCYCCIIHFITLLFHCLKTLSTILSSACLQGFVAVAFIVCVICVLWHFKVPLVWLPKIQFHDESHNILFTHTHTFGRNYVKFDIFYDALTCSWQHNLRDVAKFFWALEDFKKHLMTYMWKMSFQKSFRWTKTTQWHRQSSFSFGQ